MSSEAKIIKMCRTKDFYPNESEIDKTKLKAAFLKDVLWPQYQDITVGFIGDGQNIQIVDKSTSKDADPLDKELTNLLRSNPRAISVKEAIKRIVRERIEPLVNLKFNFIEDTSKAMVKIGFDLNDGAWSVVGYNKRMVTQTKSTMNFQWFQVSTILHEFGHLLGLVHEHQNPNGNPIQWNREAVLKWALETQGWDVKDIEDNILNSENKESINGSTFDPLSIMLYFYPAELTTNNMGAQQNLRLSGKDVLWICKTYPKENEDPRVTAENFYQSTYGESLQSDIDKSERMVSTLYSTVPPVPPVPTFPPVPIVTTVPPVPTFPPVPIVTTVPPVPIVKTVPNKSNSTIFIVVGIIFGLFIIWGVIAIIIKNKK